MAAGSSSPTARRWELAARLRSLRIAAGVTLEQAAAELLCSVAKISRMETAGRGVQPRDVRDLARLYKVPDDVREELMTLATEARKPGWWQDFRTIDEASGTYIGLESAASECRLYATYLRSRHLLPPRFRLPKRSRYPRGLICWTASSRSTSVSPTSRAGRLAREQCDAQCLMQPTWTVLIVALIGVVGTLGAAAFSQVWSARREDRRWRQEQLAEERRWERERQRQREQWQREDAIRTTQHRDEAYAQFALAVAKWASTAYTLIARVGDRTGRRLEQLGQLRTLAEQAEAACVPLQLYAPRDTYVAADEVCRAMTPLLDALGTGSPAVEQVEQAFLDFQRISTLAMDRARHDLGVASTTMLPPGDLSPS